MFCCYCGNELPDDSRFCSRCGRSTAPPNPPVEERRKGPATTNWPRHTQQADPPAGKPKENPGTTGWPKYGKPATPTEEGRETPSFAGTQASFDNARKTAGAALTEAKEKAAPAAKKLLSFAKSHKLVAAVCCVVLVFVAMSISNDIYFARENAKIAARIEAAKASQSTTAGSSNSSGGKASGPSSAGGSKASGGTVKADKSSTAVPDLGAFLGCARRDTKSGETYSYTFDDDKGLAAVDEYRALLTGSYNFKEVNFKEEEYPSSGLICYNIYYSYTGSGSVGSKKWPSAEQEANIFLLVNHYTWEDRVGVSMSLGDGIVVENSGVTASDPPTDMSGASGSGSNSGSGSGSGVHTPEFAKQDCSICKGTGKCQTCGGRGYLYSSASKKYDRNCYGCHNADGKCTYCGGTGKR